jgi:histidyl-tRNA synthetase
MQSQSLPGFRDFYPDDATLRNHIFAVWRSVAARYGFEEYDGPPLEPLELYVEKSGPEIVEQLYSFVDKGGRAVALRPEMTPTLARMVTARVRALKKPVRWFSMGQMFRYERQQRGRLREHYQLNMDLIGEPGPLADAELIAAAVDLLRGFGLTATDARARISDRRVAHALLAGQGLDEGQIGAAYAHIDKLGREPHEALVKSLRERAGLSPEAAERALNLGALKTLDAVQEALAACRREEAGGPLAECVGMLEAMGLGEFVEVDLSIVRGLAYYTGIVFELFDVGRSLRAICGGGRYDGLLEALGGVDLPATGFAMGDVVLGELLRARSVATPEAGRLDAFLVAVTGEDIDPILRLAHDLRDAGRRVEFALKQQSVAKQLKLAAARPARWAVVVGPEERAMGEALVRDLASGAEERVSFGRLAAYCNEESRTEG